MKLRFFVISAAFALLMISVVAPRFSGDLRAYEARHWLQIPCEIVTVAVLPEPGSGQYRLALRYRYDLGGQILRSSRISFGPQPRGSEQAMHAAAAAYRIGELTTCRVNPAKTSDAVLDAGFPTPWWQGGGILALIVGAAASLAWLLERLLHRYRQDSPEPGER